ncbi:GRAM domain-containing protein 2B isoform X2 [Puntigrus tetrazona]|uniref:GRAM domain-containing protein 2B isoform X2 n=1 Tax=Puntigrus tetrazona TaxID=1606681 RepID=UPI001C8AC33A|nr:GRAM domain-containing protein 2B isoform X2 [Puntigrus tetrazona]
MKYITHRSAEHRSIKSGSCPSMMGSKKTNRRFSLESSGYQLETEAKPKNSLLRRSSDSRSFQNPDESHLELLEHSILHRSMTIEEEGLDQPDGSAVRNSFKTHNKTFHKLFPEIPETEDLEHSVYVSVHSCGLQKEVIYLGKMYLSSHHICFHSSVLLKDTKVMIHTSRVQSIKKKHTAKIVPNAISVITTDTHKYLFVSVLNREACFRLLQSLCPQLKVESRKSSTENTPDMEMETISSQSSLEENHSIRSSLQQERSSLTPHGEDSRKQHNTGVSWVTMVTEKVSSALSSNETRSLDKLLLFYVILVILLLLSSGYIGLRIVALEQQLSSLGSMPEFSLNKENEDGLISLLAQNNPR